MVSHHPNVCLYPSASASVPDFVYAIFPTVFNNGFQILRFSDHGQDLELINFSWPWLNFQGHRGACFKINFYIFPVVLYFWLSN